MQVRDLSAQTPEVAVAIWTEAVALAQAQHQQPTSKHVRTALALASIRRRQPDQPGHLCSSNDIVGSPGQTGTCNTISGLADSRHDRVAHRQTPPEGSGPSLELTRSLDCDAKELAEPVPAPAKVSVVKHGLFLVCCWPAPDPCCI